jgi:hypothetical protein
LDYLLTDYLYPNPAGQIRDLALITPEDSAVAALQYLHADCARAALSEFSSRMRLPVQHMTSFVAGDEQPFSSNEDPRKAIAAFKAMAVNGADRRPGSRKTIPR